MHQTLRPFAYMQEFECLGADCEDTCCKGWGMQVDAATVERYRKEAPELLEAVTSGEAEHIMKRNPETDYCVKFENGLCNIHKDKGTQFLGDACHFFPRIHRSFNDTVIQAGALSCPEITRLTLFGNEPFKLQHATTDRLPASLNHYLPESLSAGDAEAIVTTLLSVAGDNTIPPERTMARLIVIAQSLENFEKTRWAETLNMMVKFADGRLLPPQPNPLDPYYLVQFLIGLIHASKQTQRPRLEETVNTMQQALGISIDPKTLDIMQDVGKEQAAADLAKRWNDKAATELAPILHRWIQAQLAMACYPFAGFGNSIMERTIILCVRFATVRLALMCHMQEDGTPPDQATIIRVVQSLSRFMDHLANPELSLSLYHDAGWDEPARLRSLIGDIPD